MRKMNYYISDLHFRHNNILKHDQRPFENVEKMEKAIINNWNSVVWKKDTVYILGDFCWQKSSEWVELLQKLNGKKILIRGNHDPASFPPEVVAEFDEICDYKALSDNGQKLVLSHYPMLMWDGQHKGHIHLYGHLHNSIEERYYQKCLNDIMSHKKLTMEAPVRAVNVGAMMSWMQYTPRTLNEILSFFEQREDEYDAAIFEEAYAEYEASGKKSTPIEELWRELDEEK